MEFRLEDLFYIEGTKSLDSNAINFVEKGINFVGRTFENNGIQGVIEKRDFEPNCPFTITATVIGNYKYAKYQKEAYYCSQNINKLTPKEILLEHWNEKIAYFFVTYIQKFISLYDGQQGGYKLDDIRNHKVFIPQKNTEIDFDFMENIISQLEAFRLSQLEAYLLVTGLNDYTLNNEENQVVMDFKTGEVHWGEFTLGDLFDVKSSNKKFDANKVEILSCGFPYVVRTALNNGIKGFLNEDSKYLNRGNTISFGQDTATMFYQKEPYFTGDKIKVLEAKNEKFGISNAQFFISSMAKSFNSFAWGSSSFNVNIIKNRKIFLPIKNNVPDYDYMALLISAVQKLVIKDVVLYADRKIAATKQVIEGSVTA